MKLLVDMNLSPSWVNLLNEAGLEAEHWSKLGAPDASDQEIMAHDCGSCRCCCRTGARY